ncbi:MAG: phospholipid/cholesterol/gamma-HCH transport system substrate-binding protein [Pseudonocardiales bacterium]|nr:phospholipid/cholesterol/gamma-HCH transport system substrate-binding protein [Pseudonocardiales bacterium]
MITTRVRLQLLAFVIVTVLGVGYVSVRYLGAGALFGAGPYPVTLQLNDSGGIFTGADVTYRGVSVGRVGPLRLTSQGIDAQLEIEPDAPPIPADLDAVVSNLSVIGEQFVDLRPARGNGPTLRAGSVIPAARTSTPVPVGDLIAHLDTFLRSVPLESLRTVVHELGTAFTGTGTDLQILLDSTDAFTRDAIAALPQTVTLIRDGRVVLQTQNEQSSAIISFSRDLALLAAQLRSSDPDLRRLIATAPQFADQTSGLLRESGTQIGQLLADLLTVSRVTLPRQAALRHLLSVYPVVTGGTDSSVVPDDGFVHLGLALNLFDPYACVRGYQGTIRRSGTDTTPIPANRDAFCAEPPGSSTDVRGAQNVPRAGTPAAVLPGGSTGAQVSSLASILEGGSGGSR